MGCGDRMLVLGIGMEHAAGAGDFAPGEVWGREGLR